MASLKNCLRLTMVLASVSLAALVLSYLALTDIYHGEADVSAEWTMVRVALTVFSVFTAITMYTLMRVMGFLKQSA